MNDESDQTKKNIIYICNFIFFRFCYGLRKVWRYGAKKLTIEVPYNINPNEKDIHSIMRGVLGGIGLQPRARARAGTYSWK